MTLIIEKDIPFPDTKRSKYADIVIQMQVGDSVKVHSAKDRNNLYQQIKLRGHKAMTKKLYKGDNVYRIWRTG